MPALAMTPDGRLAVPLRVIYGLDVVAARILHRLRSQQGDWLQDRSAGLPFAEWWGGEGRGPSPEEVAAVVRLQLEAVPGVIRVESVSAERRGHTVSLTASVRVSEDGDDGILTVSAAPDPYATSAPIAWYVSRGTSRPHALAWR